jgi:hypothetical protein
VDQGSHGGSTPFATDASSVKAHGDGPRPLTTGKARKEPFAAARPADPVDLDGIIVRADALTHGYETAFGHVVFTGVKTADHDVTLQDFCGTSGGNGFGIWAGPRFATPVNVADSPDYENTSGCGTYWSFGQSGRQVFVGGVAKDLVWASYRYGQTDNGQKFLGDTTNCFDNQHRAGNLC